MISLQSIIFAFITFLLSLIFPVLLAVWFCRKYKVGASSVLFGALTFFVTQILIRIPLLQIIGRVYPSASPIQIGGLYLFLYSVFLAATAALFEEGGRALFFSIFLRQKGDWKNGAAFGIGHGGIESILLVGMGYMVNLIIMIILYTAGHEISTDALDPLLGQSILLLINTPSHMFLAAGFERLMVLFIHIGLSILVVYGIAIKRYRFVFYAFVLHFFLNLPVVYFHILPGGIWIGQAYILIFAVLSLIWLGKSKFLFRKGSVFHE